MTDSDERLSTLYRRTPRDEPGDASDRLIRAAARTALFSSRRRAWSPGPSRQRWWSASASAGGCCRWRRTSSTQDRRWNRSTRCGYRRGRHLPIQSHRQTRPCRVPPLPSRLSGECARRPRRGPSNAAASVQRQRCPRRCPAIAGLTIPATTRHRRPGAGRSMPRAGVAIRAHNGVWNGATASALTPWTSDNGAGDGAAARRSSAQ